MDHIRLHQCAYLHAAFKSYSTQFDTRDRVQCKVQGAKIEDMQGKHDLPTRLSPWRLASVAEIRSCVLRLHLPAYLCLVLLPGSHPETPGRITRTRMKNSGITVFSSL